MYDLKKDPYEQNNLADDPAYRAVLEGMKKRLIKYTETFKHPFPAQTLDFVRIETYRKLTEKTKSIGTDHIYWFKGFDWPPEK